ncbi:hypothetical protein [Sandaracinus amylolyticus]|uniref:Uncharacterized protein n=1 Tax=Sandaracinus amylolyticus TaxID=927083 RepID=A0A0F6YFT7_9BACT|nr:hypothetical protein [Sandaracinus amylolyticus]AKF03091.1 hypothetical protein DB32_000240 [Sandaracinus amylolyticus]
MSHTTRSLDGSSAPELDRHRDRGILGVLALVPGSLLTLAIATIVIAGEPTGAGLVLLAGHFVTQFIVLLVYAALLVNDEGLDPLGRALFGATFLFGAPVALPVYYVLRVLIPSRPEVRGRAIAVRLATATV